MGRSWALKRDEARRVDEDEVHFTADVVAVVVFRSIDDFSAYSRRPCGSSSSPQRVEACLQCVLVAHATTTTSAT